MDPDGVVQLAPAALLGPWGAAIRDLTSNSRPDVAVHHIGISGLECRRIGAGWI